MKTQSQDIRTIDELDLSIETLKDLTPSQADSADVRGGRTTQARICYCGSM
jgi:hypothetical protein